jgi:hypothetical protein
MGCRATTSTRYDGAGRGGSTSPTPGLGGPGTTSLLDRSPVDQAAYHTAFDAWAAAKAHSHRVDARR